MLREAVTSPNDRMPLDIYDLPLLVLWSWYSLLADPRFFLVAAASFVPLLCWITCTLVLVKYLHGVFLIDFFAIGGRCNRAGNWIRHISGGGRQKTPQLRRSRSIKGRDRQCDR